MSLCDRCYAPGSCCKRLFLWFTPAGGGEAVPPNFHLHTGAKTAQRDMTKRGLPFVPNETFTQEVNGVERRVWSWNCPKLGKDGRCTIYEHRPHACSSYVPAQDGLCVHFNGAEAGDPTVPIGD